VPNAGDVAELGEQPAATFPVTYPKDAATLAYDLLEHAEHADDPRPLIAAARALLAPLARAGGLPPKSTALLHDPQENPRQQRA